MVAAEVETSSDFRVVQRRTLFSTAGFLSGGAGDYYAVAPDDQRFLLLRYGGGVSVTDSSESHFILVQNWFEELRERMGER
jgi:hypothetical protein